ncbi:MAG: NAD(P)-binding domain-containing protein, partial [Planctomycetota bacterium]
YYSWLHGQWPAGGVERLPRAGPDGTTAMPGVYIVGDLTGVPLLKFSIDSGVRAVRALSEDLESREGDHDLVVIGGGSAGVAAAIEAKRSALDVRLLEATQLFNTIVNFPVGKPIYTYPNEMQPPGEFQVAAETREQLLDELRAQAEEHELVPEQVAVTHVSRRGRGVRVHLDDGGSIDTRSAIIAIGRSGKYRRLEVPGEDLDKVSNRLHDPRAFCGQEVCIVGGGDSACEAAIAFAECDSENPVRVTLVYRRAELSRPKPENVARVHELSDAGRIDLRLNSEPVRIDPDSITIRDKDGGEDTLRNDAVFAMIGREAPLDFFRRSRLPIHGEYRPWGYAALVAFLLFAVTLYAWKGGIGPFAYAEVSGTAWDPRTWLPEAGDPRSLWGTILRSAVSASFWVTLLYSMAVVGFGIDRMWRKRTPYVQLQTLTLMMIQVLPLFILPEILLPWLARNELLPEGVVANLFPDESWWRAYGFILAWPLMVWNWYTQDPLWWWLGIGAVQTFLLIPLMIYFWGKGAYCGWICSCGALAETMGDRHREKMPHGTLWNKVNMVGQFLLLIAAGIMLLHAVMWATTSAGARWSWLGWLTGGLWKQAVDWVIAGGLGVGLYFWFSGRVWCRFACPLAALMHIYHRFSRFRIVPDSKKCISCNACTSVCHQGIDVMSFANKGRNMADPQCVRCSACVQTCPTGVLQFGQVDRDEQVIKLDGLRAKVR